MTARLAGWLVLGALLAWFAPPAQAAEVQVRWEPVSLDVEGSQETISHYLIHLGRSPRPADVVHSSDGTFHYERVTNAGKQTEHRFADLKPATWFFAVTAVDTEGNLSAYSAEFSLGIPDAQGQVPPPLPTPQRPTDTLAKPDPGACGLGGGRSALGGLAILGIGLICLRRRPGR